jgi:P4 family phage/plasmid primase-like protien
LKTLLNALFQPGDPILLRPVETWTEGGRKRSRVDRPGVEYFRVGIKDATGQWVPFPQRTQALLARLAERSAAEKTNMFFGVCPRYGGEGHFDQAWAIRVVRCLWADVDGTKPKAVLERCQKANLPAPSVLINSGSGCHTYWLLSEPCVIDDTNPPPPAHTEWIELPDGKRRPREYIVDASGERLFLESPQNRPTLSPKAQHVQDTLSGIAHAIGGDHVQDLARLLRVAPSWNRKDERNGREPIPSELVECEPDRRYNLSDFDRFAREAPSKTRRDRVVRIPLPKGRLTKGREARLSSLLTDCAAAEVGQRSEADFAYAAAAVEFGLSRDDAHKHAAGVGKFAEAGERYFDVTWEAACQQVREQLFDAARQKAARKKEVTVAGGPDVIEADDDPHRLARLFLDQHATHPEHGRTLWLWREEWWQWTGTYYRRRTVAEMRGQISETIKQEFDRINLGDQLNPRGGEGSPQARKVTMAIVSNVVSALGGMVGLNASIQQFSCLGEESERTLPPMRSPADGDNIEPGNPRFLYREVEGRRNEDCRSPGRMHPGTGRSCSTHIALRNGILDLDALLAGESAPLRPHTPCWFSPVCLPYQFNPSADCPTWKRMTAHNMEHDPERIALLQEWAGYLLTPDTSQQKFLFLEGEGSNGKSVYCAGLEAMLGGEANVTHVALENFGQRFALWGTIGKLANIATEVGELDKASEGFLKSFTGGDRMTFDRKGLSPVEAAPTARLMLAANNRPRFSDRSSGLWRRMILVPFRQVIARGERIVGADKIDYWQRSGELPGIFNWAIAGLFQLRKRGDFQEPEACRQALDDYREEANPARSFLLDYCEQVPGKMVSAKEVYEQYKKWCAANGNKPLNERHFGIELKRCFPGVVKRRMGPRSNRSHVYEGVECGSLF